MNVNETKTSEHREIDASCRVPLLALFGGAALWLVVGSVLALLASITFHKPECSRDCPWLTYGRAQPAANDALLYGFCIPAGLGVMLWIFARLSQAPNCAAASCPVAAANLWHLGVLVGMVGHFDRRQHRLCLAGISARRFGAAVRRVPAASRFPRVDHVRPRDENANCIRRTGFCSPRCSGFRGFTRRPICFSSRWPVRGVAQAVIDWWFANNLVFVWLALVGIGTAFYFLPKLAGRPLQSRLSRAVRVLDADSFRHMVRHSAGRAGAGVAADVQRRCRRCC